MWWELVIESLLLGVGLAMDACAVSMANGLNEPHMRLGKTTLIAGAFGFFQAAMPLIGWVCVHFIAQQFEAFAPAIPYIALVLLVFIGGKMIYEGVTSSKEEAESDKDAEQPDVSEPSENIEPATLKESSTTSVNAENSEASAPVADLAQEAPASEAAASPAKAVAKTLTLWVLFTQAIATSIDALSVGFTIAEYNVWQALISAGIIAVVTFIISFVAVFIGKKFGTKLGHKAEILGGVILIGIGIEIFVTGVFF